MSNEVYGFKEDKCKVEVPTKEEFNDNDNNIRDIINKRFMNIPGAIREIPFISVNLDTDYFYGANSATDFEDVNGKYIIVQGVASFDGSHKCLYTILNLETEEITKVYKDYGTSVYSHGSSFFSYDGKMYQLEKVGANSAIRLFSNIQMDSELIQTGLNIFGLCVYNDEFYGLMKQDNTTLSIVKLDNTFTNIIETHTIKLNNNSMTLQNFKYANGYFWLVHSNGLLKIDVETFEIIASYTSLLISGEYEDIINIDDNIYILINCGDETPSYAIVDSNLNPSSVSKNHLFAFGETIYVNGSRSGIYETGYDANTAIHSSIWASFFGESYGFKKYLVVGDSGAFKFNRVQGMHIEGSGSNNYHIKLGTLNNCQLYIKNLIVDPYTSQTNVGGVVTKARLNACTIYLEDIRFPDTDSLFTYAFFLCRVIVYGTNNDFKNILFDSCSFQGAKISLGPALMILDLSEGITAGATVPDKSQFTKDQINSLMNNSPICFELSVTATGTINCFIVGYRYYNHRGSVFAGGYDVNGHYIRINISAERVSGCTIDGQNGYIRRVYPLLT